MKLSELTPELITASGGASFGAPRNFHVAAHGRRILFLRSNGPTNSANRLWRLDHQAPGWAEQEITLGAATSASKHDLAMHERSRERAGGITSFSADRQAERIALVQPDGLVVHQIDGPTKLLKDYDKPALPKLSPDGHKLAFISGDRLIIGRLDAQLDWQELATFEAAAGIEALGYPDFIAAEEIGRMEGLWWSPDAQHVLVQGTDQRSVPSWNLTDPSRPAEPARTVHYPAAGTVNATVHLYLIDATTGKATEIIWDKQHLPYLVNVVWTDKGGLTLDMQSRDQRQLVTYTANLATGELKQIAKLTDQHWVEVGLGTVDHTPDGALCRLLDKNGQRTFQAGAATPQLPDRSMPMHYLGQTSQGYYLQLAPTPTSRQVGLVRPDGSFVAITSETSVAGGLISDNLIIVSERNLKDHLSEPEVHQAGQPSVRIKSHALTTEWPEDITILAGSKGDITIAVLKPSWYDSSKHGKLPVVVSSYGGPHHAAVLQSRNAFLVERWYAEQGFAVISIDGIGAPGRSVACEQAIAGDFSRTLDSQVAGLEFVLGKYSEIDANKVAIRGWSFGGYLAALAAIKRPDIFKVAGVGAPVSDWLLYDTHYTERYLGLGDELVANAHKSSLITAIDQAAEASKPVSPMLIMHGYSDDNVYIAHSIKLVEALTAHAIPHSAILLPHLSHVGRGNALANLIKLEMSYFKQHLT